MSYEYKDEIIMNLKDYNAGRKVTGGTHAFESKLEEIHNVYAQADKADEYEAKAKAFDSLKNKLENEVRILSGNVSGFPYVDAPIDSSISHFERVLEMMKKLEGGGSDD